MGWFLFPSPLPSPPLYLSISFFLFWGPLLPKTPVAGAVDVARRNLDARSQLGPPSYFISFRLIALLCCNLRFPPCPSHLTHPPPPHTHTHTHTVAFFPGNKMAAENLEKISTNTFMLRQSRSLGRSERNSLPVHRQEFSHTHTHTHTHTHKHTYTHTHTQKKRKESLKNRPIPCRPEIGPIGRASAK